VPYGLSLRWVLILEFALNIGWFALSLGLFGFFALCVILYDGKRSPLTASIALLCIACLLFPVISMTDDLNSSPAIPEATKLKKLFPAVQFAIHLFSHVPTYPSPQHEWAALAFEQKQKPAAQELMFFDLSRRPPPQLPSL